jgi:hypothetical protein
MIPNYPTNDVKEFGERLMSSLYDASIQKSMAGLGGCKEFDLANFDPEFHPYIQAYLEGNNDSMAIVYAAMRTRELNTV